MPGERATGGSGCCVLPPASPSAADAAHPPQVVSEAPSQLGTVGVPGRLWDSGGCSGDRQGLQASLLVRSEAGSAPSAPPSPFLRVGTALCGPHWRCAGGLADPSSPCGASLRVLIVAISWALFLSAGILLCIVRARAPPLASVSLPEAQQGVISDAVGFSGAEPSGFWNLWAPGHTVLFHYGPRRGGCACTLRGSAWTPGSRPVLSAALALSALPACSLGPLGLLLPACHLLAGPPSPRTLLWCWPPALWVTSGSSLPVSGMSHEPKSPSLGMLSTATRTTATVNPLTPSPLNGALVPSGSPATSSALSAQAAPSSSFAAALRKLAKQAEEPRGKRRPPAHS